MLKTFSRLAAPTATFCLVSTALAANEIRPGDALPQDAVPAEAQHYESLLQAEASPGVAERRHFDARWLHLGLGTGLGTPVGLLGVSAELSPLDRLAIGAGAGLGLWGPTGGGYARLRPIIWGGEGARLLNAVTLQASYTVMQHGEVDLLPCIDGCENFRFLSRTAQYGALALGLEHQLASGWTFRYDFGLARALFATPWRCERDGTPAPCDRDPPGDNLAVVSFNVGHTL